MKDLFGRISEKLKKSEDVEWFGQVRQSDLAPQRLVRL